MLRVIDGYFERSFIRLPTLNEGALRFQQQMIFLLIHPLLYIYSYNVLVDSFVKICDVFCEYNTYHGSQTTATDNQR